MGNLAHEAGDPTLNKTDAEEIGGGGGFGLAQWTGSRRTEIHSVAREQGRDVNDLQFQLEYLYQEMQTRTERDGGSKTEEQGMKEQQTVEEAVYYFMYNYERPGVDHEDKRLAYAKEYLVRFGGTGGSTSSGGGGNECDESGSGGMLNAQCGEGGFIGTLRCYAWPEYRGLDVTPTEEYREHVIVPGTTPSKGESDIYIGGLSHDGIDCGGFVTRLIIDSGFDPEYNYGGLKSRGGGPTGNQMAWAKANWTTLGQGNEINVADLRPGDVAISGSHTFVFIGPVEGFEPTNIASASLDERAPMAGNESITDSSMTWFGKR